jgi:hypothetical protein
VANGLALGLMYGWERYDRDRRNTDVTDEDTYKAYLDFDPAVWLGLKASAAHSERRANAYDPFKFYAEEGTPVTPYKQNPLMRVYDLADRDRDKLDGSLEVVVTDGLIVKLTGGWRRDEFPDDNEEVEAILGLKEETVWSAGGGVVVKPTEQLRFSADYLREEFDREMVSEVGGNADSRWGSDLGDIVDTYIANITVDIVPRETEFSVNYVLTHATTEWLTYSLGANEVTSDPQFPDVESTFQRIEAVLSQKLVNSEGENVLGGSAQTTARLSYALERSNLVHWAYDELDAPYFDPIYRTHAVALSVAVEW